MKEEKLLPFDLEVYRKMGDPKADDFVQHYFSEKLLKIKFDEALKQLEKNADWTEFLNHIPEASWFEEAFNLIPPIDSITYQTALKFYKKRETYILQLLGLLSLPYCYAAADGAKVLYQTERMYKDVAKRLEETAKFITAVMNPNAFEQSGAGKIQIFKVRIMHAAARFYLCKSNWDGQLGFPINQEDMAGTNLSFSIIVIRGLRKMGFAIHEREQLSFIKYWSWIGAHLGVNHKLLPQNGKEAHDLEQLIRKRQFKSSEHGMQLAQSLLKCFYDLNDQKKINNNEIAGFMRFLLGDQVADILDIPKDNFELSKKILLKLKVSFI